MKPEDLRSKLERRPFRAFMIQLDNGTRILIERADDVLLPRRRPELVFAFTADGAVYEFELGVVTALVEAS